ncbi:hypothetical protein I4U23_029371 [Adineta vaga]|nr:hypothetical protein I4U23_029371 [Adineta vaga]
MMIKRNTSENKQISSSPLICQICGDTARGINFSATTCMSCKMFFRRHVKSQMPQLQCRFDNKCIVTPKTRKFCSFCRLKLCFQVGMNPKLIRSSQLTNPNIQSLKLTTNSLLDNDHSTLTLDEWNLLSNIIHAYDEHSFSPQSKIFFQNQFSLPFKLRCKDSGVLNHIGSLFSTSNTFIECCPLFQSLPSNIRHILIKRNLAAIGSHNGLFVCKEMNVFENEIYSKLIDHIYGNDYSNQIIQASQRLDQNGILIKIMLMIMIFLNNCTIVLDDFSENFHLQIHPEILLCRENSIVTMLWKYLIYQYGFREATLRYACLVKCILDMIQRMGAGLNKRRHWIMVDNIMEQKTRLLSLKD